MAAHLKVMGGVMDGYEFKERCGSSIGMCGKKRMAQFPKACVCCTGVTTPHASISIISSWALKRITPKMLRPRNDSTRKSSSLARTDTCTLPTTCVRGQGGIAPCADDAEYVTMRHNAVDMQNTWRNRRKRLNGTSRRESPSQPQKRSQPEPEVPAALEQTAA